MASPDTNPQSGEFERWGKFRVVVEDTEALYQRLAKERLSILRFADPTFQAEPETSDSKTASLIPDDILLGESSFDSGLLSTMQVYLPTGFLPVSGLDTWYSSNLYAYYLNPKEHGKWTKDEADTLRILLADMYGANNVKSYNLNANDLYTVDDQEQQTRSKISIVHNPGAQEPFFIYMNLYDITTPTFNMFDISGPGVKRLKLTDQSDFTAKMESWGKFIGRTVNAIAQTKGVPQGGTLTLGAPKLSLP